MSFSSNVKKEICKICTNSRHCNLSLLSSLLVINSNINHDKFDPSINFFSDKEYLVNLTKELIEILFTYKIYDQIIFLKENNIVKNILSATGILEKKYLNPIILKSTCCKREYLKGLFLSCGSISDPEKTYHLEFVLENLDIAKEICKFVNSFNIKSKVIKRKQSFIVYLKDSESISLVLNIIGAHVSLLNFENVRVLKEVRNNLNRSINCETENIKKIVSASYNHVKDIELIINSKGFDYLKKDLQDISKLRLKFTDASLKELGELSNPKISKASVNYKFKKINEIADDIRGGLI